MHGEIPVELGVVGGLLFLDFSYNNLTGNIPHSFVEVEKLNLSYNSLRGQIPRNYNQSHTYDTLIGNKDLCGVFMYFPPCIPTNNKSIVINQSDNFCSYHHFPWTLSSCGLSLVSTHSQKTPI